MYKSWKPTLYQTHDPSGLLCVPKWFKDDFFRIHTRTRHGNQHPVKPITEVVDYVNLSGSMTTSFAYTHIEHMQTTNVSNPPSIGGLWLQKWLLEEGISHTHKYHTWKPQMLNPQRNIFIFWPKWLTVEDIGTHCNRKSWTIKTWTDMQTNNVINSKTFISSFTCLLSINPKVYLVSRTMSGTPSASQLELLTSIHRTQPPKIATKIVNQNGKGARKMLKTNKLLCFQTKLFYVLWPSTCCRQCNAMMGLTNFSRHFLHFIRHTKFPSTLARRQSKTT